MTQSQEPNNPFSGFRVEIDPEKVEEALGKLRERAKELQDKVQEGFESGRHTKVRITYNGRALGPDIPLALFLAGEGIALIGFGPLRFLAGNLGVKVLLGIEFIHSSDELVDEGNEAYMSGDLETAERLYRTALSRRKNDVHALYRLGVLLRVSGRTDEAIQCWEQGAQGNEDNDYTRKCAESLRKQSLKRTL